MYSVSKPQINYNQALQNSSNVFRDRYQGYSLEQWKSVWLSTEKSTNIDGLEFPTIPQQELQLQIHGSSSWEITMREAFAFYDFVKRHIDFTPFNEARFLDFGCGWGRITRPFMRDFDLDRMYGFEPNQLFATIARSLNPYVCILSGDFTPDESVPKIWFDLVVGWSIFSHLAEQSVRDWMLETAGFLKPGGYAVYTTWGARFLNKLRSDRELLDNGGDIHWYAKKCIEGAKKIDERIAEFESGKFVWFTHTDSMIYGDAFISERWLRGFLRTNNIPLEVVAFDVSQLPQDAFILRRQ